MQNRSSKTTLGALLCLSVMAQATLAADSGTRSLEESRRAVSKGNSEGITLIPARARAAAPAASSASSAAAPTAAASPAASASQPERESFWQALRRKHPPSGAPLTEAKQR